MGARSGSYGEVDHRQRLLDWLTTADAERVAHATVATDTWLDAAELVSETYLAVALQSTPIRVDRAAAVGRSYLSFTHQSLVRRHAARRRNTVNWDPTVEDPVTDRRSGSTTTDLDHVLDRSALERRHRSQTQRLLSAGTDSEFEAIAALAILIVLASGDADHLGQQLGWGRGSQSIDDRRVAADLIDGRRHGDDRSTAARQRDSRLLRRVRPIAEQADEGLWAAA